MSCFGRRALSRFLRLGLIPSGRSAFRIIHATPPIHTLFRHVSRARERVNGKGRACKQLDVDFRRGEKVDGETVLGWEERIMKYGLASLLAAMTMLGAMARAQDDVLPQSVARAYVAYEAAMEAQDYQSAREHAFAAWQAADAEQVSPDVQRSLAVNFAQLATAFQDHQAAYPAWVDVAELSDGLVIDPVEHVLVWHNAAVSAFNIGEYGDACTAASEADSVMQDSGASLEPDLMRAHLMIATLAFYQDRQFRGIRHYSERFLSLAEERGEVSGRNFADVHFAAGVGEAMRSQWEYAAYHMWIAGEAYEALGEPGELDSSIAHSLRSLFDDYIEDSDFWAHAQRVQASAYPRSQYAFDFDDGAGPVLVDRPTFYVSEDWQTQRLSGIVTAQFRVTPNGRATDVVVLPHALGEEMSEALVEHMQSWRFNNREAYGPSGEGRTGEVSYEFRDGRPIDGSDDDLEMLPLVIARVNPEYPLSAARRGVQGSTIVRYDVTQAGEVVNAEVVFALGANAFGDVSIEAMESWRYAPASPDDPEYRREGLTTRFDFRLGN